MRREWTEDPTKRELGKKKQTCRICGSAGDFSTFLVREMMQGSTEEFEYFACEECGCLQIAKIPDDLGRYYDSGYYSFRKREFDERIDENDNGGNREKILDVGCGSGKWLLGMAKNGYRNLWGCDPFIESDIEYGNCIHIRKCNIHQMEGDGEYSIIHMGDSLEHMEDPIPVMKHAARLLKDDGSIVLHVPVFPNIVFDMFGAHWYQIDAPRHLHIPSVKTLDHIAKQSGLTVCGMEYDANMLSVLISWFYQHGVSYHEISEELITDTFSEESLDEIRQMNAEANRRGNGDAAGIVLKKK